MYGRLIIDGNSVYEIDETCVKQRSGGRRTRGTGGDRGNASGLPRTGTKENEK